MTVPYATPYANALSAVANGYPAVGGYYTPVLVGGKPRLVPTQGAATKIHTTGTGPGTPFGPAVPFGPGGGTVVLATPVGAGTIPSGGTGYLPATPVSQLPSAAWQGTVLATQTGPYHYAPPLGTVTGTS